MRLIITIPAFNEEKTLPEVIKSIPRKYVGVDSVKILVYSDGSTDRTVEVAKKAGADYVFVHKSNQGLAQTFRDILKESLKLGADYIVNTDADNQYEQKEIGLLLAPLLKDEADMVIGDRQVGKLQHMPLSKKYGNMLGSFVIRFLTGTHVSDASSGFRAFTAELAKKIFISSDHTYTHEMIIAAHFKNFRMKDVPVTFYKRTTGGSRLISGVLSHIVKSGSIILRTLLLYRALSFFTSIGGTFVGLGFVGVFRFLYFALIEGKAGGHIQSLVISSILVGVGFNIIVVGFLADLLSYNRKLIEERLGK